MKKKLKNFSQKFFENFEIKIRINRSKFRLAIRSFAVAGQKIKTKKEVKKYE